MTLEFKQFSGKERDTESGNDYFGARYFSGAQGRFTSPDAPFADQTAQNPQSWNLYSYGRNNPLSGVDPDGRGFWQKLGNLFTDAGCFCEGDEARGHAIVNRRNRAIQDALLDEQRRAAEERFLGRGRNRAIANVAVSIVFLGAAALEAFGDSEAAAPDATAAPAAEGEATEAATGANYVGENIVQGSGKRVNSDLPGGQAAAEAKFKELTKGQSTSIDPKTGATVAADGTRLRNNPTGTSRIDRPASVTGGQHETIHFNNLY